jgi:quercetin dioxygenase-like cupin family protein
MRLERIVWPEPEPPAEATLHARLARDGFDAFAWTDPPRATYTAHHHDHDECLWVVTGEITFGTAEGAFGLRAGDRLMLPAGTVHTAEAGPDGATYLIGQRRS